MKPASVFKNKYPSFFQIRSLFCPSFINFYLFFFLGGNRDVAEEMLRADKQAQPSKIHYFFSASKELPGKFMLSYLPRTKATHEFVTITPEGLFVYRFMTDLL